MSKKVVQNSQKVLKDSFKARIFLFLNLYLVISSIIVTYITLTYGTVAGQVDTGGNYGIFYLATFTVESNILLGLVAGVMAARRLAHLDNPKSERAFAVLYLVATAAAMLTFLTVVLLLAPVRAFGGRNYFDMLMGPMFFFHFFNPVVAAVGLIFFSPAYRFTRRDRLFALIPPAIYAVPYIVNVVFTKAWPDFYGLTLGGRNYFIVVSVVVFFGAVYLISLLLSFLHNRAFLYGRSVL